MIMINDRLCDLSLFIKEMVVLAVPNMNIAMKWGEGVEDNVFRSEKGGAGKRKNNEGSELVRGNGRGRNEQGRHRRGPGNEFEFGEKYMSLALNRLQQ